MQEEQYQQLSVEGKADFWQGHIEAWMKTSLSQADYCRQEHISKSRFNYWKRKLYPSYSPLDSHDIIQLPITLKNGSTSPSPLKVELGRYQVQVNADFCPQVLKKLIQTLEGLA